MEINRYIDHTMLKADASRAEIEQLCREAIDYGFYAVCVNSANVAPARTLLAGSPVKIASVVGFPLGAMHSDAKAAEAAIAAAEGAAEIDMVLSVGYLKDGHYDQVQSDIARVVRAAADHGAIVKVILETCLLSDDEIVRACRLAHKAGAAFVKTSTGFSTGGATIEHVRLMKQTVGDTLQVKASGGIRTYEQALAMIKAGADRIGASRSVEIVEASSLSGGNHGSAN
ncbi:MAG TPA: deoxyribose-phosphate aldolase [Clostridiales bacterium]|jgi:deoxyribose-phosphate aldolase|nr:deoxyribose-phosphate aldolase [Clostridiales bacterium]